MSRLAVYVACAEGQSIDAFLLDTRTGSLSPRGSAPLEQKVQCLAMHPAAPVLYAALASEPPTVRALSIAPGTGTLVPGSDTELAAGMAYLSVSPEGNLLLGASYSDHLVAMMGLDDGGAVVADGASSRNPGRHAHAVLTSPDGKFAYATALGDDRIVWWTLGSETGEPGEGGQVAGPAGSGPRHLRFSPSGETLYALHEMSGDVAAYSRDLLTGKLTERQRISSIDPSLNLVPGAVRDGTGPDPAANAIWCAELQLTPDGRFLYSTERSSGTVAIIAVDQQDGSLSLSGTVATQSQPRGMNIDPSGEFLLVCGETSNRLSLYRIDPETGTLEELASHACSAGPRWIEFAPID